MLEMRCIHVRFLLLSLRALLSQVITPSDIADMRAKTAVGARGAIER
jgi:hypothetical protein